MPGIESKGGLLFSQGVVPIVGGIFLMVHHWGIVILVWLGFFPNIDFSNQVFLSVPDLGFPHKQGSLVLQTFWVLVDQRMKQCQARLPIASHIGDALTIFITTTSGVQGTETVLMYSCWLFSTYIIKLSKQSFLFYFLFPLIAL